MKLTLNEAVAGKKSAASRIFLLTILVLGVMVCLIAISPQSYWIDEGGTAWKAVQPNMSSWWQAMREEGNSNLQLPAYLLFTWAWEKLAGLHEFALRAGNALWFLPGLLTLALALNQTIRRRWCVSLALLVSPFAWFYLNEARPYAMQIGASCIVFAALLKLGQSEIKSSSQERRWVLVLCLGSLLLAGSGMLAMLWLVAYLAGAIVSSSREHLKRLALNYRFLWLTTLALLFIIGLFYLWTLSLGARATMAGTTDVRNIAFIFYELLGFDGLGPGRVEIREKGLSAFHQWILLLSLYGCLSALLLVKGWREVMARFSLRTCLAWLVAFGLVLGFILAVGLKVHFRVLGRHCTPMLPLILFIQGIGLAAWLKSGKWRWQTLAVLFFALCLVSDANLRFAERHAKDDYRDAAQLARNALARGEIVWWSADLQTAWVYHVPTSKPQVVTNSVVWLVNPESPLLKTLPRPDLVLLSKPDLYDGYGSIHAYLKQNQYTQTQVFQAFTVWRKSVTNE